MCGCGGTINDPASNQTSAQLVQQSTLATQSERDKVLADMQKALSNARS